ERIKARIEFRYLNLAADGYPSPSAGISDFDLILCRNVLIYFDEETVRRTAERLAESLAPDGWLVTGPSHPPLWDHVPLEPVVPPAGVFYCRRPQKTRRQAKQAHPRPLAPAKRPVRAVPDARRTPAPSARPSAKPAVTPQAPSMEASYLDAVALFAA